MGAISQAAAGGLSAREKQRQKELELLEEFGKAKKDNLMEQHLALLLKEFPGIRVQRSARSVETGIYWINGEKKMMKTRAKVRAHSPIPYRVCLQPNDRRFLQNIVIRVGGGWVKLREFFERYVRGTLNAEKGAEQTHHNQQQRTQQALLDFSLDKQQAAA